MMQARNDHRAVLFNRRKDRMRDDAGNILREYGLHLSLSLETVYVCFCHHRVLGQHLHAFNTEEIAAWLNKMLDSGMRPKQGSKGWGVGNTGAGYHCTPSEFESWWSFPFVEEDKRGTISERSIRVVEAWLRKNGWHPETTCYGQQMDQIDIIATKGGKVRRIEVKSRAEDKGHYDGLFFQTHESNPNRARR